MKMEFWEEESDHEEEYSVDWSEIEVDPFIYRDPSIPFND